MEQIESFIFYRSFFEACENLKPNQQGELLMAVADYALNGEERELSAQVKGYFTLIKPQIDANSKRREDGKKGAEYGKLGAEYGKLGGRPRKEKPATGDKENPVEGDIKKPPIGGYEKPPQNPPNVNVNVNVNDNYIPPISPPTGGNPSGDKPESVINNSELSEPVKSVLKDWIQYKRERREGYKPSGLKSLVTIAMRYEKSAGSEAVCKVIGDSMSSGYKGIVWDRLNKTSQTKPNVFNNISQNTYDFDALERELMKN